MTTKSAQADDTTELTKLGILILDEKNGVAEAWGLDEMNILLFPYSSATLPDLKSDPLNAADTQ